jgi:hypothetical protein
VKPIAFEKPIAFKKAHCIEKGILTNRFRYCFAAPEAVGNGKDKTVSTFDWVPPA